MAEGPGAYGVLDRYCQVAIGCVEGHATDIDWPVVGS